MSVFIVVLTQTVWSKLQSLTASQVTHLDKTDGCHAAMGVCRCSIWILHLGGSKTGSSRKEIPSSLLEDCDSDED